MFVHMGGNTFPGQCDGFFDGQFFEVCIGDFIEHLDAHVVPPVKIDAVLGQGIFGTIDP